jgi:D-sedoheptulose 7-phosphate isomerase
MRASDSIRAGLQELARLAEEVARERSDDIEAVARVTLGALRSGGRLFFCGNGGSAADAQHLAAEYVVRFGGDREALPAMALTTDSSILTAASNDHGFETVFSRQIEALGRTGDVLFLHSTSGESANLIRAADAARARGVQTIALLAKGGGRLQERVDHAVVVPTEQTARAQEIHLALGHLICEIVDRAWTGSEA